MEKTADHVKRFRQFAKYKMRLDELDVAILSEIYLAPKKSNTTTWTIAKKYTKSNNLDLIDKMEKKISWRLSRFEKYGIIVTEKNSKKVYLLNTDKLTFCRHKCSDGMKYGIWIRI